MKMNARKYSLISKSRSYYIGRSLSSASRAMAHNGGIARLDLRSNASQRSVDLWSNARQRSYQQRLYNSKVVILNPDHAGGEEASHNEAQCAESEITTSRLSKRGARFKAELLRRIVPWDKIPVSFHTFPYYIDNDTKSLLMECAASHLQQKKYRKYGGILTCSSNRIQLQSIPGTELYRERLVSAMARELQVPLLKLDSSILPPYDINHCCRKQLESDEDSDSSDDATDVDEEDRDKKDFKQTSAKPDRGTHLHCCRKQLESNDKGSGSDQDLDSSDDSSDVEEEDRDKKDIITVEYDKQTSAKPVSVFKRGDRVKYVGHRTSIKEAKNRILDYNHRGELHEVNGDKVAVIFNDCGLEDTGAKKDEKSSEATAQEIVTWLNVKDVRSVDETQVHDCFIALELLYEVLMSQQPIVVYFHDSFFPNLSIASHSGLDHKAIEMFEKLKEGVVLICGHDKKAAGSEVMKKFPDIFKPYIQRSKNSKDSQNRINKLFNNVVCIKPPKGDEYLDKFVKQIEEDRKTVISEGNLSLMHQVLKAHGLICTDLEQVYTTDVMLTREEVEKIVAWATNHCLSSSPIPCVKNDVLHIPHESLKVAMSRLKGQQKENSKMSIKDLAEDKHEEALVSAVVCAGDIGVKFDDVGALENVKTTLYDTVILPLRRPELFSHGNLQRPCKGILLFRPPGTGKTLMAKALATEAGANFINVTTATLTSVWVGETERLTRALFTYARKLAPSIIFVDEVDSLFAARGHNKYDTSRLNEFMASWDGLISKDSERIVVIGATNRPFDLDDAVLRRMPTRVYVGLPDATSRSKILKVLLVKENLEGDFSVEQLAEATEGYSGDDLKNLCVAAAYRPVKELLQLESKGEKSSGALRPLRLDDFILSKAKVRASVSSEASSIMELRRWDEKYGGGGSKPLPFGF